ncbi:hypothetical protein N7495_006607 [Penicillium taxi]|uniref:uncharacterized protein n=1 Tax=Penicillium taxi TaxID=168475 RepID=UPI002545964D|nr:uncharacterized protein N7495_006607 [Penicillium taxi]KAJ5894916.1 hypothetical protein N7495_006607 [Penicillium taxi]
MEATQESTQPCADPRRMGMQNSGLQEDDLADIICILHPNSHCTLDVVAATAAAYPQHILQKDVVESKTAALDVALRLSSSVHDVNLGFCFGRNRDRCDVLLSTDDRAKRISNCHFRIYLTSDGIIMLQDVSTNGTIVDNHRLRKTQKDNSRMLTNGSVIQVVTGREGQDELRFVVRIPSREGFARQYTQNILQYFECIQRAVTGAQQKNRQASASVMPWSVSNAYGMHWTGGSTYNVTGQIGKGAFATVYKLATKQHGAIFAAKELDKRRFMKNGILDQKVDNEMKIMRDLHHPNIVQFIDYHEHDRWIYIIMEYVPGGELSTWLSTAGKIPEEMVQTITRQLLRALHYLHARRITHRDVKPDNILIASLDPLRVKLSDFGLSKVTQEESFLKTFCGTLLYCAPEVYPDYDTYRRGEARKRRRVGDPPAKPSPYSQAVDMWSLGAVLYHILCGVPPYSGHSEDRGAHMLRSIMTADADFGLLRKAGISEAGIDFITRLLNRDPSARPTERECFQHQWIANVVDVDDYEDSDIVSEAHDHLSVIGEDAEDELDASQLSIHDSAFAHTCEPDDSGSSETLSKRPRIDDIPASIRYPSLPQIESFQDAQVVADNQARRRLFGEVTSSALLNSRQFDAWASNIDEVGGIISSGESMSDAHSVHSIISLPENPFGGTAPSLMGAENLVGRLNMHSSNPFFSPPNHPVNENSPRKTIPGHQKEPVDDTGSPPRDDNIPPTSSAYDTTPKARKTKPYRNIEPEIPETASERSSGKSAQPSRHGSSKFGGDGGYDIEFATTLDAQTGQVVLNQLRESRIEPSEPIVHQPDLPSASTSVYDGEFAKPSKLLGRLKSVPGSILDVNIRIDRRWTSWGRGMNNTYRHENIMDSRIPVYALEITFWAAGIEPLVAKGHDWMHVPGLCAVISTKARKCIWVNGVELRRGRDEGSHHAFPYGKLYTGDIITIYERQGVYLSFECEFFHSDSVRTRPADEPKFEIQDSIIKKASSLPKK